MHARPLRVLVDVLQIAFSSLTQGPNTRPCRTHRVSVAVSVMEIFSTFLPLAFPSQPTVYCLSEHWNCDRLRNMDGPIGRYPQASFAVQRRPSFACELLYPHSQMKLRPSATSLTGCRAHVRPGDSERLKDRESRSDRIRCLDP